MPAHKTPSKKSPAAAKALATIRRALAISDTDKQVYEVRRAMVELSNDIPKAGTLSELISLCAGFVDLHAELTGGFHG